MPPSDGLRARALGLPPPRARIGLLLLRVERTSAPLYCCSGTTLVPGSEPIVTRLPPDAGLLPSIRDTPLPPVIEEHPRAAPSPVHVPRSRFGVERYMKNK